MEERKLKRYFIICKLRFAKMVFFFTHGYRYAAFQSFLSLFLNTCVNFNQAALRAVLKPENMP